MVFGLAVGAFFAYLILLMNPGHVLNIMLPGSLVGLIVGYAPAQMSWNQSMSVML